jgi:hypothetical protein
MLRYFVLDVVPQMLRYFVLDVVPQMLRYFVLDANILMVHEWHYTKSHFRNEI